MICKVRNTLSKFSMLENADEVIVGFSGGADSTCLLYILNSLKDEFGIKIHAAHLNHCLRGQESDRDEAFVRDFCCEHSIKLSVRRVDILNEAKQYSKGIEEYARQVRYEFFNSLCSVKSVIATAHNLNDCEETLLFNLARGSSLKGLCSIPPVRENVIRPLIECTRDEIEDFCKQKNLGFVTDSSNLSDDYTRNKIRHNIIPLLKDINPAFDSATLRCIDSLRVDEKYLSLKADELYNDIKLDFGYNAAILRKADVALSSRVISNIIYCKCGVMPEKKHINAMYSILDGGKTEFPKGEYAIVKSDILYFLSDLKTDPFDEIEITFDDDGYFRTNNITLEIKTECTQKVYKELVLSTFDFDKIKGNLYLRKRKQGDKITLPVRKVTKTLKKLFNEMEIIPEIRDSIYVISDEENVVWVEKIGVDLRVAPDNKTKNFVNINVLRDK